MLNIRVAAPGDEQAVLQLAASFATSFAVEEQAFRSAYAELLNSPDAFLAVAEIDGGVIGYVLAFVHFTFYANGRVAWVEEITVAERLRRQGVGERLMHAVEAWAREREARLVALATRRAASFYQAIGYEESAAYFRKRLD